MSPSFKKPRSPVFSFSTKILRVAQLSKGSTVQLQDVPNGILITAIFNLKGSQKTMAHMSHGQYCLQPVQSGYFVRSGRILAHFLANQQHTTRCSRCERDGIGHPVTSLADGDLLAQWCSCKSQALATTTRHCSTWQ